MKTSEEFANSCREWYQYNSGHNYNGRQIAYIRLTRKYGRDPIFRHLAKIKAALNNIETRVFVEVRNE